MRRFLLIPLMVVLVSGLIFGGCAAPAPEAPAPEEPEAPAPAVPGEPEVVELSFAHELPESTGITRFGPWLEEIERVTEGRVKMNMFSGETLGPTHTYVEAVKSGMIDIAWISLEFFEGRWPLSMVGYLPIGISTIDPGSRAVWELYKETPEMQAEFAGMKVLALYMGPPYQLFASKRYGKDVRKIEDMEGMLIKVGGGLFKDAVVALGGAPVTIPAPGMYEALTKGTIDGAWFVVGSAHIFLIEEVCRSVTMINMPDCTFALIMSPQAFDKMTPKDQKLFESTCYDPLVERLIKIYADNDVACYPLLEAAGVEIIHPEPQEYERFQRAIEPMVGKWLDDVNAMGLPATEVYNRVQEIVKELEAK